MVDLTESERRALQACVGKKFVTPAEIGYAMTPDRDWPLKPQGAGRVGGGMAQRLIKRGLMEDASRLRFGFPAYRVTGKGLKSLNAMGGLNACGG